MLSTIYRGLFGKLDVEVKKYSGLVEKIGTATTYNEKWGTATIRSSIYLKDDKRICVIERAFFTEKLDVLLQPGKHMTFYCFEMKGGNEYGNLVLGIEVDGFAIRDMAMIQHINMVIKKIRRGCRLMPLMVIGLFLFPPIVLFVGPIIVLTGILGARVMTRFLKVFDENTLNEKLDGLGLVR